MEMRERQGWLCLWVVITVLSAIVGCEQTPVQPVAVPRPDEPSAYRPVQQPKPLPQPGDPGIQPGAVAGQPPAGAAGAGAGAGAGTGAGGGGGLSAPSLPYEDLFLAAYSRHSPRMMVFVNRTIEGSPLSNDQLLAVVHAQNNGAVGIDAPITAADYEMIEAAMVRYFDNSGKVRVQDSDAARAKLNREQVLRIENGDPNTNRLLATELQTDVLVRVMAQRTAQSANGPAIRILAKAVSTTDARVLGIEYVDMSLPMSKQSVDYYSSYLVSQLMRSMAAKWTQPAQYDPIEVRIYKAASIDDSSRIANWIKKAPGVQSVNIQNATAAGNNSYAVVVVGFTGGPWALYEEMKDGIGQSQGLKAVDMQNNTVNLEVTGPMNLVTTTRAVESTTTIETRTIEERKIEPISPATSPAGGGN